MLNKQMIMRFNAIKQRKAYTKELTEDMVDTAIELLKEQDKPDTYCEACWMPVSERPPKKDGNYLVTTEDATGMRSVARRDFAKNLYKIDNYYFYDKNGISGWYCFDSEYGYWEDPTVIAWAPVPTPYQGEK